MKKLLLFFMVIALFVTASCTTEEAELNIPEPGNPTVELIGLTDSDNGLFISNSSETQSFFVSVNSNGSLYTSADGTQLKSWISSTDHFSITYEREYSLIHVTPIDFNYSPDDIEATLTVKLNNNIGSETYELALIQEHPTIGYITFEDDLFSPSGTAVTPGEYTLNMGKGVTFTYSSIYISKDGEYYVEVGDEYDDIVFTAADGLFQFGAFFMPNVPNADDPSTEVGDEWAGFVLSNSYTKDPSIVPDGEYIENIADYQFTAWADTTNTENNNFLVVSIPKLPYIEFTYDEPTIDFPDTVVLCNVDVANTAYTYLYDPRYLHADSVLYFDVVFTGARDGVIVGSATGNLIVSEDERIADWTNVDLSTIGGAINSLKVSFSSNDYVLDVGINVPLFVALDNLTYIKEW